ncbi:MAG: cytochrome ubiquinol oxidase subunit I, partial [Staphylococcus hominis]
MTAVAPRLDNYVPPTRPEPTGNARKGSKIYKQLTTTDHKELGIMYIIMSFVWFFVAG